MVSTWWDGLSQRFWRSPMSRLRIFNLSSCSSLWTVEGSTAWSPVTTPVPLVLGSFLTKKALGFGCLPLVLDICLMRRAVHTELSPCDCPPNIRCLVYGSILWSAIRPNHMAAQITSLAIVYSIVYSEADQRKHQNSASLAFVWGIRRGPVNSPHKWPVTRKMFPLWRVCIYHLDNKTWQQDDNKFSVMVTCAFQSLMA